VCRAACSSRTVSSLLELRPYQKQCLERIRDRYREGRRRVLISLPTGTGKTVIFANFPRYFAMQKRLLVLAHRRELLDQAVDKFRAADPEQSVEVEQADRTASAECKVVVASVQTLGRHGSKRLGNLDPEDFYLIVVDEAHHAVAKTYRRIFKHFGLFEPDTRRMLVGFTATPSRGDGEGLGEVFEEIAFDRSLPEMIGAGYLCSIRGYRVTTNVDLDSVRFQAGEFVESDLAAAVDVQARNELLVRAYHELTPARRCIVFCVNIEHSQDVARAFCDAGVKAAAVWGTLDRSERADILARFGRGELDLVTNCNVLTEGFDEPRVDAILMARPTHSKLLYTQMVGRGTRLHTDKDDLIVVDIADNTARHNLVGLHALFDLPDKLDLSGTNALETAANLRNIGQRFPWIDLERVEAADDLEMIAERIELFRFAPPSEIAPFTPYTWTNQLSGGYRLLLPDGEFFTVEGDVLGYWTARFFARDGGRVVAHCTTQRDAICGADRVLERERQKHIRVVDRHAKWRDQPPSTKQLEILRSHDVPTPPGLTRGQASWMISHLSH
jgi:superfamily II DNA or RNA helicase